VATKFDGIFSGYQPCQVSSLNRLFEDHLILDDDDDDDDDRDGPRSVGSVETPDTADSSKIFHRNFLVVETVSCILLTTGPLYKILLIKQLY
jgi:hypothetical protein